MIQRREFWQGAAALALTGLAPAAGATALPMLPQPDLAFNVLRNGGVIGQHHVNFTEDGNGDILVTTNADTRVIAAGIQLYRLQMFVVERWQQGVFVALDSHVNQDGTPLEVHAQRIDGGFAVQATKAGNYHYTGPQPMLPLTYWNKRLLQSMILNSITGRFYPPIVSSPGWNYLPTANGGEVLAQRFDVTGKLKNTIWYDQNGAWDGLEFHYLGDISYEKITG